ncbi:fibronectin type III domain-containing protein [Nocardioides solisilvae]|uniref:fibronectin type III domain-containing protein n=1 Tax=Nocardioides solisilvae TaxID=1542435 RepID=UPI0013A541E2|nr:fibronectin type III domain-containing protein [Nocardioides solisilvae]
MPLRSSRRRRLLTSALLAPLLAAPLAAAPSWAGPAADGLPTALAPEAGDTAPRTVVATAGLEQAHVTWQPPTGLEPAEIGAYVVTVTPGRSHTAPRNATELTLHGLTPGQEYQVTVRASSQAGLMEESAPVTVTPYTTPTIAPTLSLVQSDVDTSVVVGWQAANPGGSRVVSYAVMHASGATIATVGPDATSTRLTGLPVGDLLQLKVRATMASGLTAETSASAPFAVVAAPTAPQHLVAVPGDGSVHLGWGDPARYNGSYLTGWRVTVSPGGAVHDVAAGTAELTLTGLANGTRYDFAVAARNARGWSPEATVSATPAAAVQPTPPPTATPTPTPTGGTTPTDGTTPEPTPVPAAVPGKPGKPAAKVVGAKVTLTWKAPATSGADRATRYKVVLRGPGGRKVVRTSTRPRLGVKGLRPGRYRVTVSAGNASGWSKASRAGSFTR